MTLIFLMIYYFGQPYHPYIIIKTICHIFCQFPIRRKKKFFFMFRFIFFFQIFFNWQFWHGKKAFYGAKWFNFRSIFFIHLVVFYHSFFNGAKKVTDSMELPCIRSEMPPYLSCCPFMQIFILIYILKGIIIIINIHHTPNMLWQINQIRTEVEQ